MNRLLLVFGAAFTLLLTSSATARAEEHAFCSDPSESAQFTCGIVTVDLVPGGDLDEVVARSAPEAEAGPQQQDDPQLRTWFVYVAEGEEVATRDALRADADVEDARLSPTGFEGDALPDTAMGSPAGPVTSALLVVLLGGLSVLSSIVLVKRR